MQQGRFQSDAFIPEFPEVFHILFFLVGSQQHAVEDGVEVHQVVRQSIRTVVADVQVGADYFTGSAHHGELFAHILGVGGHFIQHGQDAGGNVEFALVLLGIRLSQAQQHPFALDLKGFFEAWGHVVPRILLAPVGKGGAGAVRLAAVAVAASSSSGARHAHHPESSPSAPVQHAGHHAGRVQKAVFHGVYIKFHGGVFRAGGRGEGGHSLLDTGGAGVQVAGFDFLKPLGGFLPCGIGKHFLSLAETGAQDEKHQRGKRRTFAERGEVYHDGMRLQGIFTNPSPEEKLQLFFKKKNSTYCYGGKMFTPAPCGRRRSRRLRPPPFPPGK